MALTTDQFRDQLIASELLSPEDVSSALTSLSSEKQPKDGEQLARELVRQKKLTKYQAEQIYSGRGKTLVLGNYVVLDKLGQGGMGVVLKAEHKRLKRLVALKVMSASVVKTPDALKRFHREVEAAAKLRHNNVVATDDADEAKGTHFLVMEYVEGSDLSALVKKKGPLSVSQSVQCILQAARGLEFAHSQGVVHRDIKPANLLLDSKGTVKILDMGLARIEGDAGSQGELTSTGAVMGTVDYMAPEQALSTKHADARSDIYSLGISLWYLLTGKCAYEGDSLMAKLLAHRDAPIPSLCRVDPDIPASVDAVFRKMVAKQGKDRYQSMTEVIRELECCLSGSSTVSSVSTPDSFGDPSLQSFLSNLGGSPSATAATRQITAPATGVNVNSANEATMLNGDIGVKTDPQTMASVQIQERLLKPGRRLEANKAIAPPWYRNRSVMLGGGAAAILFFIAVIVLIQTPHGTLRVEIHDPDVVMKLKGTGITFQSTNSDPISLAAGDKKLIVTRGDLSFETETFTLRKGAETLVRVELVGDKLTVRDGEELIAEQPINSGSASASMTGKDPKTTTSQGGSQTLAEREALDGLFSMGAIVLVGVEGSVEQVLDTSSVMASGKPLACITLDQRLVSDEELARLVKFPSIFSLRLAECFAIADSGMRHIGELPALNSLVLSGTRVGDEGLLALRKCSQMRQLHLRGTRVTGSGMATISQFSQLSDLELGSLPISDASLAELQKLSMLDSLAVNNCERLTSECGGILSKFPALRSLNLEGTSLGDVGVEGLSASLTLRNLNLNTTRLTDAAVPGLCRLSSLVELHVNGTQITREGIQRLSASLPSCVIHSDYGTFQPSGQNAVAVVAALQFDGTSSHVELPMFPLDATGPLTIEAWFTALPGDKPNANDVDAKTDAIWSLQNPQSKAVANCILDRANDGWWFGAGVERLLRTVYYSFTRTDKRTDLYNVRHHAAFVRDGDEVRLYVDGIPLRSGGTIVDFDKTPPDPAVRFTEVEKFFLGAAVSSNGKSLTRYFHGNMDEFRISNSVRYTNSFTPEPIFAKDADTVALYHFDEGQGEVLGDSSGNNHHGRIVGAKWLNGDGNSSGVDMISMLDMKRDAPDGSWEVKDGTLSTVTSAGKGNHRLSLPIEIPPEEYDVRLQVQRTSEGNALVLGIVSGSHRAIVAMDGFRGSGGLWGLENIDGKGPAENGTGVANQPLKVNEAADVLVQVRKTGIRVERDGKTLIDWKGPSDKLTLHPVWDDKGPPRFFLGAQAGFIIQRLEFIPVP
jgi:serine/threonine protein kinase